MNRDESEREQVRRALAGDEAAFDRLVRLHTPDLFRLVRRMAADAGEAEALVQETWLRAWRHRSRCAPDRPFFPWLATIAGNLARDAWRKRRPLEFSDSGERLEERSSDDVSVELQIQAGEARARLAEMIEGLRPEWRLALALRYDGGLEYEEIAKTMGIPVNTVRSHLRRAKLALRERLEADNA